MTNPYRMKIHYNPFILFAASCLLALSCTGNESEFAALYEDLPFSMPVVSRPEIPSRQVDIRDFGCVGDGRTLNTEAFGRAIADLSGKGAADRQDH